MYTRGKLYVNPCHVSACTQYLNLRQCLYDKQCQPETNNAEQIEEVCHQGWRFTLHSQGWTQAVDYRDISAAENNPGLPCRQVRRVLRKGQNPPEDCIKVCYHCYYKWFSNTLRRIANTYSVPTDISPPFSMQYITYMITLHFDFVSSFQVLLEQHDCSH